jgi:hypothetical protein
MTFLKRYSSIKDFLYRFTILQIGSLHIRVHKIVDRDRTTLLHNHPFNYVSIVLKGGYSETYLYEKEKRKRTHTFLSIIKRRHNVFHRIDDVKRPTFTLFIAYGKYNWKAENIEVSNAEDGVFTRVINNKKVHSKRKNGIWFIGNKDYEKAANETRHSIHQH